MFQAMKLLFYLYLPNSVQNLGFLSRQHFSPDFNFDEIAAIIRVIRLMSLIFDIISRIIGI